VLCKPLLQVLYFGLPAAAAAVLANSRLTNLLSSSSSNSRLDQDAAESAAAAAATTGLGAAESAAAVQALLHISQEAVLAALMPAAVWLALGNRVVSLRCVQGCYRVAHVAKQQH
jgi:hypothetical protein